MIVNNGENYAILGLGTQDEDEFHGQETRSDVCHCCETNGNYQSNIL